MATCFVISALLTSVLLQEYNYLVPVGVALQQACICTLAQNANQSTAMSAWLSTTIVLLEISKASCTWAVIVSKEGRTISGVNDIFQSWLPIDFKHCSVYLSSILYVTYSWSAQLPWESGELFIAGNSLSHRLIDHYCTAVSLLAVSPTNVLFAVHCMAWSHVN